MMRETTIRPKGERNGEEGLPRGEGNNQPGKNIGVFQEDEGIKRTAKVPSAPINPETSLLLMDFKEHIAFAVTTREWFTAKSQNSVQCI